MKIGVIGSGNIGSALGRLWAQSGHQVLFSSRHPEQLTALAAQAGPNARTGSVDEAGTFGDVILEAVPFGKVRELPANLLRGKVVLSAANYYPQRDGDIDLKGLTQSEYVASQLPGARLVKAFNMMQARVMDELADGSGRPGLVIFIASDDAEAKQIASQLVSDAKFTPMDVGTLRDGALFQTDGPLYNTQFRPEEAAKALDRARAQTR